MTDFLLISPSYLDYGSSNMFKWDFYSLLEVTPPLGIMYVASSAIHAGYKVQFIDVEAEKIPFRRLGQIVREMKPRLVGIGCLSPVFNTVIELSGVIKSAINVPVIIGGPHTLVDPDSIMELKTVDYCIRGEADFNIVKLLDFVLKGKGRIEEIEGASYKINGRIIHNKPSEVILDLDSVHMPARHLLKRELYFNIFNKKGFYTDIVTTRGCPFECLFCFPMYGRLRRRSIANVISEIRESVQKYEIKNFDIFDDTFNLDRRWVIDFCNALVKEDFKINWRARCRPDLFDKELVQSMERAGCETISMGVESANNHTLKWFNKMYSIEEICKAVDLISQTKINLHGYFILGAPVENREEMLHTIRFACERKFDFATFSILTPYPGTELFKIALRDGYLDGYNKNDYSEAIGICKAILKHPTMTKEEIQKLFKYAYRKFYLRQRQISLLLKTVISKPAVYYKIARRIF